MTRSRDQFDCVSARRADGEIGRCLLPVRIDSALPATVLDVILGVVW
ncbi:hypothetical protein [Halopelagius inordinatus]|nr:hypothetical protein [Halopelagius inordinatus]